MIERLRVEIDFSGQPLVVGQLAIRDRIVYFRYADDFLQRGLHLSPFYLPLKPGAKRISTTIFDGLPGVFADSLPDGWGRLLLDRALVGKGKNLDEITVLDRLAYVGNNGPGALKYYPVHDELGNSTSKVDLDLIANAATVLLKGGEIEYIDQLVQLGGSSGGARPKVVVGYAPGTGRLIGDARELPAGYEHWLIKFPASADPSDIAKIEIAYHEMALAAGLRMQPCRLFTGQSGQTYFGTKRFDRTPEGDRLHLHSAAGLMYDNFRLCNMDYGNVMDAIVKLNIDGSNLREVLRLAAFNVFSHNLDDHSKNISFLMDSKGKWQLAPAYDLTFSYSSHGYQSMMVARESHSPGEANLLELADVFRVDNPRIVLEEVREAVKQWPVFAAKYGVTQASIKRIKSVICP